MPSVRYYNQTGPFWDFVADIERQQAAGQNRGETSDEEHDTNEQQNPWAAGWGGFPWGPFPHRGRHGPHPPPPHHGGPPPPRQGGPPPPHHDGPPPATVEDDNEGEAGPSEPPKSPEDGPHRHGRHSHHGPPRGPWGRGGPCGRGRGFGMGPRGRNHWHPYAAAEPWSNIAELFTNQLFSGDNTATTKENKNEDFKPEADVFDTSEAFVIHVSLPGAKKEDVGVNWDAEKSELSIAGVIYRPGDEEFLKTLALDERKIGAFERKVRLGSRANPAQVDVDGINARMEDGVLTVEVPKLDAGYVEIKKVDIE